MTAATPLPAWTLRPVQGDPYDSTDTEEGGESIGWDLSFGCRLNVLHTDPADPSSPLAIDVQVSDMDKARGFCRRQTEPAQLIEFAKLMLNIGEAQLKRQAAGR
jgi:hypothetical protein